MRDLDCAIAHGPAMLGRRRVSAPTRDIPVRRKRRLSRERRMAMIFTNAFSACYFDETP